jgi:hypothetical protein
MTATRVPIPDHPAYLVVVADNGDEWARRAVTLTYRLDPETCRMNVGADFESFTVKPKIKKRAAHTFRIEYRDMADTLLFAGDWQARYYPVRRGDVVSVDPGGAA